jgi:integrase
MALAQITTRDIEDWWTRVCGTIYTTKAGSRRISPDHANHHLEYLRRVCKKAVAQGILDRDPTQGIKTLRSELRVRWIADAQLQAIFTRAHPKLRLYVVTAHYTAARQRNVRELRVRDIDFERRLVSFPRTKGKHPHVVPLHPRLAELLRPLCVGKQPGDFVLPQYKHRWRPYEEVAGGRGVQVQHLRVPMTAREHDLFRTYGSGNLVKLEPKRDRVLLDRNGKEVSHFTSLDDIVPYRGRKMTVRALIERVGCKIKPG